MLLRYITLTLVILTNHTYTNQLEIITDITICYIIMEKPQLDLSKDNQTDNGSTSSSLLFSEVITPNETSNEKGNISLKSIGGVSDIIVDSKVEVFSTETKEEAIEHPNPHDASTPTSLVVTELITPNDSTQREGTGVSDIIVDPKVEVFSTETKEEAIEHPNPHDASTPTSLVVTELITPNDSTQREGTGVSDIIVDPKVEVFYTETKEKAKDNVKPDSHRKMFTMTDTTPVIKNRCSNTDSLVAQSNTEVDTTDIVKEADIVDITNIREDMLSFTGDLSVNQLETFSIPSDNESDSSDKIKFKEKANSIKEKNIVDNYDNKTITWRDNFNNKVFNTDFKQVGDSSQEESQASLTQRSNFTKKDIKSIINLIELYKKKYIEKNPQYVSVSISYQKAYRYSTKYTIINSEMKGISYQWLQLNKNKKRVCSAEDIFEAIHLAHTSVCHKRVASTYLKVSEIYCNITESHVRQCVKLCHICNLSNDSKRKKHKGPGVSIKSKSFRERIQVDLIDYQTDPRENHNGVKMRWLMTVKDHFTKFMWLRPLQRKQGILVASELRILFHEIGFPLIFHSDNGREFINEEVYSLLSNYDPSILMVRGAPRTPRHQGSVENGNQHIKTMIDKQIECLKSKDSSANPGWVDVLGHVTSALNSSVCYGNKKLTPYRHVFTQDYEFQLGIQDKDKHQFKSIRELNNYLPRDKLISTYSEESSSSSGDDEIQSKNTSKKRTQCDNNNIQTFTTTIVPTIDRSAVEHEHHVSSVSDDHTKRRARRTYRYPMTYVMITDPNQRQLQNSNQSFEFVYGHVDLDITNPFDTLVIDPTTKYSFGSSEYYKYCIDHPTRFWEHDLLILFGTLQTLECNDKSIMLVDNNRANGDSSYVHQKGNFQPIHESKNKFVSILYKDTHYSIVVYNRTLKNMSIYDGLCSRNNEYAENTWSQHLIYLRDRVDSISNLNDIRIIAEANVCNTNIPMHQNDSFSCGPIACVVLWYIFNNEQAIKGNVSLHQYTIRSSVIVETRRLIDKYAKYFMAYSSLPYNPIELNSTIVDDNCNSTVNSAKSQSSSLIDDDDQSIAKSQHTLNIADRDRSDKFRSSIRDKHSSTLTKIRGKENKTVIGDIVSIRVPEADRTIWRKLNLMGIVFKIHTHGCSIFAVTDYGILCQNANSKFESDLYITPDKFEICDKDLSISHGLSCYRKQVLSNTFNDSSIKRISMAQAHIAKYGSVDKEIKVKKKCKCANGRCTKSCGCYKAKLKGLGLGCNQSCSCLSLCMIGKLHLKPCRCQGLECKLASCGCIKSGQPCTYLCACENKCTKISKKNTKVKVCRCNNQKCTKTCGCISTNRQCTPQCRCKGLCHPKKDPFPPTFNVLLCQPTNDITEEKIPHIATNKCSKQQSPEITNVSHCTNKKVVEIIHTSNLNTEQSIAHVLLNIKESNNSKQNKSLSVLEPAVAKAASVSSSVSSLDYLNKLHDPTTKADNTVLKLASNKKDTSSLSSDSSTSSINYNDKKRNLSDVDDNQSLRLHKYRTKADILSALDDRNIPSPVESSKSSPIKEDEYVDLNLSSLHADYKKYSIPDNILLEPTYTNELGELSDNSVVSDISKLRRQLDNNKKKE